MIRVSNREVRWLIMVAIVFFWAGVYCGVHELTTAIGR